MRKKSRKKLANCRKLRQVYGANKNRCENPNNAYWYIGGGKGIKFKFKNFEHFRKWSLRTGYIPGEVMLRRRNTNKDYTPHNCFWSSKRNTKIFDIDGDKLTTKQLSEKTGLATSTLLIRTRKYGIDSDKVASDRYDNIRLKVKYKGEYRFLNDLLKKESVSKYAYYWRVNNGWSIERAIETPTKKRSMPKKFKRHIFLYKGEEVTIEEISDMVGIKESTIRSRFYRGVSVEDVINNTLHKRIKKVNVK